MRSITNTGDNCAGELPLVDIDAKALGKRLTLKIRTGLLRGEYPSEGNADDKLIRDFRASGLSVEAFLEAKGKMHPSAR